MTFKSIVSIALSYLFNKIDNKKEKKENCQPEAYTPLADKDIGKEDTEQPIQPLILNKTITLENWLVEITINNKKVYATMKTNKIENWLLFIPKAKKVKILDSETIEVPQNIENVTTETSFNIENSSNIETWILEMNIPSRGQAYVVLETDKINEWLKMLPLSKKVKMLNSRTITDTDDIYNTIHKDNFNFAKENGLIGENQMLLETWIISKNIYNSNERTIIETNDIDAWITQFPGTKKIQIENIQIINM